MTAALDVSYPPDTVSEVGRSCAFEKAERQNTEAEPYPLWDAQPVARKSTCWLWMGLLEKSYIARISYGNQHIRIAETQF